MSQPVDHKKENRELLELLNEVRVVVPGVQVLFAFLLTIPFTGAYESILSTFQKSTYLVAFFLTAGAAILLIAPSAYHRILWRKVDKEALLVTSNRLTVVGLVLLGFAMVAVVGLVTEIVTTSGVALILTGIVALAIVALWFGIPLSRRYRTGG